MNDSPIPFLASNISGEQLVGFNLDASLLQRFDRIDFANDECLKMFGAADRSQLVGKSVFDLVSPVCHQSFTDLQNRAVSERTPLPPTPTTVCRLDGTPIRVRCLVSLVPFADGSTATLVVFREGLIEQHTIEDREGSEIPLKTILETAMDGIISMDEQQEIVLFNTAAEVIFGWRADQVLGQPIDVLIPDRFRPHHRQDVEKFGAGTISRRRMGTQRTVMALHASGREFPVEASISKTTVNNRKIYTVILRDVTDAVRYQQQIEQQSQMLDQVSDSVSVLDLEGRILYWNRAATRLFGWTAEQACGRSSRDLLYRGDAQSFIKMQRETNANGSWAGELSKVNRAGLAIAVEHRRTVLRDPSGVPKGYLCFDIDITERKKRERAAQRSQRLESIGTLAGGIAHDLNNVLTPILIGAKLLSSSRAPKNPQGLLETMVASAQRGADLVKQVLAFAGGIRGERSAIDMGQMLAETRGLLEHTLPKSIQIETKVSSDSPHVMGDATEMSQVLMNLCINARDAMPAGGMLSIEAMPARIGDNARQLNPDASPGMYMLIKVSDTGCGMTTEVLDRIFDPFFTTKEVGKGTGLGLATVQGIVKSYGGFINVYSELDRGTTFSIYLPANATADAADAATSQTADEIGSGQTVLLIDDEAFILQMTSAALAANGYRVLTAQDGETAISIFSKQHLEVSIVLLDMMMPGLDGLQTLDRLRQIDSKVVVVACSGLRTTQREMEVLERGAKAFLPKPYSEEQLLQVLSNLLKSGS